MNKTLDEWIDFYNKKAPEKFERNENFALFYLPDKGFCELAVGQKTVTVWQVCGDGRFWKNIAETVARNHGRKVCAAIYGGREGFHAWRRLFGFTIERVEEKDGLKRYHGKTKNGGWALATECIFNVDGRLGAYVTWEVKADEL